MKKTIAGDIRRIRNNILKPSGVGVVSADYAELHKAFDEIESKEKDYQKLIKELADALEMEIICHEDCSTIKVCAGVKRCDSRNYRALVAKAREVCK